MQASITIQDRVLGCLFGGALGDAWGGPFEGSTGPVRFEIPARPVLSDDTQFTVATCESIIQHGGVAPERLASHFLSWFLRGRLRGMGSSTLKAMRDLAAGAHWALAGAHGEYAAGSGAAMRIAPLAFLLDPADPGDRTMIRDVCRITHHNDEAYVGALAVALALRSALTGRWSQPRSFLSEVIDQLPDSAVRDRVEEMHPLNLPPSEVARRFGASGHVVDTVPLALVCAQSIAGQPLPVVLSEAIHAGGDTDTIASITGQLAGTVVGTAGVPHELFADINDFEEVARVAQDFAEFVGRRNPETRP